MSLRHTSIVPPTDGRYFTHRIAEQRKERPGLLHRHEARETVSSALLGGTATREVTSGRCEWKVEDQTEDG